MNPSFRACLDELILIKLAELTDQEKAEFKEHIRQQAKWDAASAKGKMTEEERAAHRHNTERIKHYQEKKRGNVSDIPGWAKDPAGKPPSASPPPRQPPPYGSSGYGTPRSSGYGTPYGSPRPGGQAPRGGSAHNDDWYADFNKRWEESKARHAKWQADYDARQAANNARWAQDDADFAKRWGSSSGSGSSHAPRYSSTSSSASHIRAPKWVAPAVAGAGLAGMAGLGLYLHHREKKQEQEARAAARAAKARPAA